MSDDAIVKIIGIVCGTLFGMYLLYGMYKLMTIDFDKENE